MSAEGTDDPCTDRTKAARGVAAFAWIREERGKGYDSPPLLFSLAFVTPSRRAYTDFVTATPTLTSLAKAGGCAAKYPAARLETAARRVRPGRLGGSPRRPRPGRRRGRLPPRRRARDRLHGRLLPTRRRRPAGLRRDRRDERAQRRLRDGRRAAARALDHGVPGGASDRDARRDPRGSGRGGPGGRSDPRRAATRFATTSRSTGSPSSAPCIPDGIWPKSGAKPGDALFLTKALGTGLVLQAQRDGRAPAGALDAAVAAMRTLNRAAADALRPFGPNAVTDVTGFGLLGHAYEMASRSNVRIELDAAALPALPGALELASDGTRTGGDRRNRDYAGPHVESTAPAAAEALAFDPQTAGGLLVSLPADKAAVLAASFAGRRSRALPRRPRRRGLGRRSCDEQQRDRRRREVGPRAPRRLARGDSSSSRASRSSRSGSSSRAVPSYA